MKNKLENAFAVVKGFLAKHKKKTLAIVAGVMVPTAFVLAQSAGVVPSPSAIINCMVAGSCNNVIAAPESSGDVFGANAYETTNWISGDFSDDVAIGDDLTVTDDLTLTGDLISVNYASSTAVVREAYSTYSSAAASQSLCALQNTGSLDRVLTGVTLVYATDTATGGGSQRFTVSLSATTGATGTGSNLLFDNGDVAVPTNGINNITTTSTLMGTGGAPILWTKNTYLNFLIASPTTTLQGDCRASYY